MAAFNSLTYLVYSVLTLAGNYKPTTDPSLNAWEIGSESQLTETWNQEPYDAIRKYNAESCPAGETWSECNAGCQETCENVGEPQICLRDCVPGCVCEAPGTVRGPDGKCIYPPLCPSKPDGQYPLAAACPDDAACDRICRSTLEGYRGRCVGPGRLECQCYLVD